MATVEQRGEMRATLVRRGFAGGFGVRLYVPLPEDFAALPPADREQAIEAALVRARDRLVATLRRGS